MEIRWLKWEKEKTETKRLLAKKSRAQTKNDDSSVSFDYYFYFLVKLKRITKPAVKNPEEAFKVTHNGLS